jgi:hypothetical protein
MPSDALPWILLGIQGSQFKNADSYQALFNHHVLPWLSATYPDENYIFQQDGVPRTLSFPCMSSSRSFCGHAVIRGGLTIVLAGPKPSGL